MRVEPRIMKYLASLIPFVILLGIVLPAPAGFAAARPQPVTGANTANVVIDGRPLVTDPAPIRSGDRVVSAVRINGPDGQDNPKPSEVLWQFDLAVYGGEGLAVGMVTTAGQKLEQVYFTDNGRLYALGEDGKVAWVSPAGLRCGVNPPAIGPDGTVYCSGDALIAFTPAGVVKWSLPVIANKFVIDAAGTIYAVYYADDGTAAGQRLGAITPEGSVRWELELPPYRVEFLNGMSIGADRRLYLTTMDGGLLAIGEPVE